MDQPKQLQPDELDEIRERLTDYRNGNDVGDPYPRKATADVAALLDHIGAWRCVIDAWLSVDEDEDLETAVKRIKQHGDEGYDAYGRLLDEHQELKQKHTAARNMLAEVAETLACKHPPDDGGDTCDGTDCIRCACKATLTVLDTEER